MKTHHLILLFIALPFFSLSQTMDGLVLGNYAGVNSILVNPSALHNSRQYLDIHLFGMDLFAENNYLYIPKSEYSFSNFFKSGYQWPMHTEEYTQERRSPYFYNNTHLKTAFVQTRVMGPGAMLLWGKHAFALTTGFRTIVSARNIPYELANFSWIGLSYTPQQNINYHDQIPVRVGGLAWGEVGLTYAYAHARGFDHLSAGITLKRLMGVSGTYVYTSDLDYVVPNDSTIDIKNMDAQFGLALPVNYNASIANFDNIFKGGGFGIDFGVTYKRLLHYHQDQSYNTLCEQPFEDYLYRIGLAFVDIGQIRFRNNAVKMNIDNRSSQWSNVDKLNFTTIDQFLDTLSYQFYGDTISAYSGDKFSMWLPSALSAQFDYHFARNWYVNSSLIFGFPLAKSSVVRPSELTITPRYETDAFEFSMPIGLYDWRNPRIGMAIRFYGVTVGTDKLGGFFSLSDFTGLDFYFSVKLFFNKGDCRIKGPTHCGSETERYRTSNK